MGMKTIIFCLLFMSGIQSFNLKGINCFLGGPPLPMNPKSESLIIRWSVTGGEKSIKRNVVLL